MASRRKRLLTLSSSREQTTRSRSSAVVVPDKLFMVAQGIDFDDKELQDCVSRSATKKKPERRKLTDSLFGVQPNVVEPESPPIVKSSFQITRSRKQSAKHGSLPDSSLSFTAISGHRNVRSPSDVEYPDFQSLKPGLDPKFARRESTIKEVIAVWEPIAFQNQHDLAVEHSKRSCQLFIDDIGYEDKLSKMYEKIETLSEEEMLNTLKNANTTAIRLSLKGQKSGLIKIDTYRAEIVLTDTKASTTKRIPVAKVFELRFGVKTKVFERNKSFIDNYLPFCISYGMRNLHLLLPQGSEESDWMACLVQYIITMKKTDSEYEFLQLIWKNLVTKELKSTSSILRNLDIQINLKEAKKKLLVKKFDSGFRFEDLQGTYRALRSRNEIYFLFDKYANDKCYMSRDELLYFLVEEQHQFGYNKDNIHLLFEQFEDFNITNDNTKFITKDLFFDYLNSPLNGIFNPYMSNVYQDMTRPLTDYFIYSSHNTYLEGNQLSGYSSSDMYARALKAGCRCVELDCWNGENGDPIIFHGHTLTSRIEFNDVVKIIADYAFVSSQYPVILSLENHCNIEQQTKMARMMIDAFGKSIAQPLWKKQENFSMKYLPSPEELKGKIIIKGKVSSLFSTSANSNQVAPELESITYLVSESCPNIEEYVNNPKTVPWEIFSFVETRLAALNLPNTDFIEFNKTNFSRVYPKGSRVESSNYNPQPWWCGGSQLVALNLQTEGKQSWTNEGLFKDNGGCGYILKPFYMLHDYKYTFNPTIPNAYHPIQLNIKVISGRQLPKIPNRKKGECASPQVEISISGFNCDQGKQVTNTISNNGFNPIWDYTCKFTINMPELATLLLVVKDTSAPTLASKSVLAYHSIPVSCIQSGYRIVPLFQSGKQIPLADLFCNFSFTPIES